MSNNHEPMDYETDPSEYEEEEDEPSEVKPSEHATEPAEEEEEEEDDEASSEEESDTQPEPAQISAETTPSSPPVAASLNSLFQSVSQPEPFCSSEEESGTESESESDVSIAGSGARKPRPDVATPTKLANGKREAEEEESCYEDSKKAKILMEILPKIINFSPTNAGSAEEMMLTLGDNMFVDGENAEEWRRLKYEEVESYARILDVKYKQAKFVTNFLKSC